MHFPLADYDERNLFSTQIISDLAKTVSWRGMNTHPEGLLRRLNVRLLPPGRS